MSRFDRPVYAPPGYRAPRGRHAQHEDDPRRQPILLVIALVIFAAFASIVWSVYGGFGAPPPRINAPQQAYKVAPSVAETEAQEAVGGALYESLEGRETEPAAQPRAPDEAPLPETAVPLVPERGPDPVYVENGPYLAQVAALQSEASVGPLWSRLSSRAPDLFAPARLDVERADLGSRGIYWRVRAGSFADRENADRFCARLRAMGQDCIAVRR
ncbi:MAG: hypothetical protein GC189_14375 [Alphaproteobacteria bacterium]|nr:hypothetical protein [Alphaproteobacteria bacterium]